MELIYSVAVFVSVLLLTHGDHSGLHPSQELICSPKGISIKMDNGMYWSSRPNGILGQTERDHTTWFQVCIVDDGKVEITDYKGEYLSVDSQSPSTPVKIVKDRKSPDCDFGLEYKNQKVILKASNGKYCSRIYYLNTETHTIEAQKESTDVFCLFDRVGADA